MWGRANPDAGKCAGEEGGGEYAGRRSLSGHGRFRYAWKELTQCYEDTKESGILSRLTANA